MADLRQNDHIETNISISLTQRWLLLLVVCMLVAYRQPTILTEPRFWAEEGTYFFSYAFSHSWFDTIFHVVPLFGFYSLTHNMAGLTATFVPLEYAPLVTVYLGFMSHLLPCVVVIFGNSPFWNKLSQRLLLCLGILLFPFGRMWLNTTYIHFTLALTVFLILLSETKDSQPLSKQFYRLLILLGGLSGAVSCFLTPAFLLKAWKSRSKEDIIHATVLTATSLVQVSVFVYTLTQLDPNARARFTSFGYSNVWSIISFQFGIPFYGWPFTNLEFVTYLNNKFFYGIVLKYNIYFKNIILLLEKPVELFFCIIVIGYVSTIGVSQFRDPRLRLLPISFLLLFFLSTAGSVHMRGGPRYTYVPLVIILLMLLTEYHVNWENVTRRYLAALCILIMLVVNGYAYRKGTETYWPKWLSECSTWRLDNSYALKIWPYNMSEQWKISLDIKK